MLTVLFQSPSKDDISTLSALEIAEQMTYLDQKIMFTINSNEFLEQAWIKSERKEKSPHIVVMTKRFNDVSNVFWEGHKNWKIFTVNFTICSNRQIDGEDFVNFVAFLENINFKRIYRLDNAFFQRSLTIFQVVKPKVWLFYCDKHITSFPNLWFA